MLEIQNAYYDLIIGHGNEKEAFWKKRLKNILESDIHKSPLGCKINNTHIKIGHIHLNSFYEAQILFSHSHWVKRFAGWLNERIGDYCSKTGIGYVNVIGYETYIEPVLFALKNMKKPYSFKYGIFEEKKYIQSLGKELSNVRIRYDDLLEEKAPCVYICGISSTLSTFDKMRRQMDSDVPSIFLSLVQIFPDYLANPEKDFSSVVRPGVLGEKVAISDENNITAEYLVSVNCKWEEAKECSLCFPEAVLEEKPIIQTSETSVVPVQMIQPLMTQGSKCPESIIDFFSKTSDEDEEYLFKKFLYYGHIDRMDHHYKYYIRTGRLVKEITDSNKPSYSEAKDKFIQYCNAIKENEKKIEDENSIKIIVSPAHYSDEVFPNIINNEVFDGKAHTLSFDLNKEYRSSFLAKYSNISYYLEQVQSKNVKIVFYYVDDQLNSIESFTRAKSLINSLMKINGIDNDKVEVFPAVIIFLSRNSESSKYDYVCERSRYYSFVDISVPSIRNYADSCPICKMKQEAKEYNIESALSVTAKHWADKYDYFSAKSIFDARTQYKQIEKKEPKLIERRLRRFECENDLWREIKIEGCASEEEYESAIWTVLIHYSNSNDSRVVKVNAEYIISIVKALSLPMLFYRENEKKAALRFVLKIINQYKDACNKKSLTVPDFYQNKKLSITFGKENDSIANTIYLRYEFLLVLINCLSEMNSNYLLSIDRCLELFQIVEKLDPSLLCFTYGGERLKKGNEEYDGFYTVILYSFKRIVCGIKNDQSKVSHFDDEYEKNKGKTIKYSDFFKLLFLENSNTSLNFNNPKLKEEQTDSSSEISIRYSIMCSELKEAYSKAAQASPPLPVLKDVFFAFYDKNMDNDNDNDMPFIFSDQSTILDQLDKDKLKANCKLAESISEGILFAEKQCLIRFHIEDNVDAHISKTKHEGSMYLVMAFQNQATEALKGIRVILKYRNSICRIISNDFLIGNIGTAIRAKKAGEIIESDKLISHGASRDLIQLSKQTIYLIDKFSKDDPNSYIMACHSINLFMNRCISCYNAQAVWKKYFQKAGNRKKTVAFYNSVAPVDCGINTWKRGWEFFKFYIDDLANGEKSQYLKTYSGDKRFKFVLKFQEPQRSKVVDEIEAYNAIPFFLSSSTIATEYAVLSLIGIIDTIIRNAIHHGRSDITNIIVFEIKDNTNANEYNIEIRNDTGESYKSKGITDSFFKGISKDDNSPGHFKVNLIPEKEEGKFLSRINIRKFGKS